MAEYIEREKLPQKKERGFFLDDDFNAGWNACLNNIKDIPAADVRPVVLCRECKNRFNIDVCKYHGDDWFCGYGERREES